MVYWVRGKNRFSEISGKEEAMSAPKLFAHSSPALWSAWTLAPFPRTVHDPGRMEKITYTARLILVLKGEVLFRTGGKDYPTAPGSLLYLPPSCVYDSDFLTEEFASRNLFFDFDPERAGQDRLTSAFTRVIPYHGGEDAGLMEPPPAFEDAPEFSAPFSVQADADMRELTERILAEAERPDPLTAALLSAWLKDLASRMLKAYRGERTPRISEVYRRIRAYAEEHVGEKLSCRDLADALNYHPNYMNRVVSRYAGMSLHEFILQLKLRQAKRLLSGTDLPVAAIAQSLAFCDASHFTRLFLSREGVTPRTFRSTARQL